MSCCIDVGGFKRLGPFENSSKHAFVPTMMFTTGGWHPTSTGREGAFRLPRWDADRDPDIGVASSSACRNTRIPPLT